MSVSLYQTIIQHLKYKINQGIYKPYDKIPTEIELAKEFNVSRITSKKALDTLANEGIIIRQRRVGSYVAPAPETDGVLPENTSQQCSQSNLVAMLLPIDIGQSNFSEYARGVLSVLDNCGYHLVVHNAKKNPGEEKYYIQSLLNNGVKGLILYPVSDKYNFDTVSMLFWNKIPLVTMDKYYEDIPIPYVVTDNRNASSFITKYLLDKGHRRIAFFSDIAIDLASSVRERFMGYCQALSDNGIYVDPSIVYILSSNGDQTTQAQSITDIIEHMIQQKVTAIQCMSDGAALTIMNICQNMSLNVPNDLSIVGFDDLPDANYSNISLTTMHQDLFSIGETAARILINQINKKTTGIDREHICPATFVERHSVRDLTSI